MYTVNERCPHCDFENEFLFENEDCVIFSISKCKSCNEEISMCSECEGDWCGSCVNGSNFKKLYFTK